MLADLNFIEGCTPRGWYVPMQARFYGVAIAVSGIADAVAIHDAPSLVEDASVARVLAAV